MRDIPQDAPDDQALSPKMLDEIAKMTESLARIVGKMRDAKTVGDVRAIFGMFAKLGEEIEAGA